MRRIIILVIVVLAGASVARAQPPQGLWGDTLSVGTAAIPVGSSVRLGGLAALGGTRFVILDAEGDATARLILRSDLPVEIAYEDELNIFQAPHLQRFLGPVEIESTLGDPSDNEIDLLNNGGTVSRFVWPAFGVNPPTVGTRSIGSRLVLSDTLASDQADYAVGVAGGTLWHSVPNIAGAFRFYGGTEDSARIYGSGTIETDKDLLPTEPYSGWIGYPTRKWLVINAAELWVDTLVAQKRIATIGGRLTVAPTTKLIAKALSTDTSIATEHNDLIAGDYLLMEADGRFESMKVTGSTPINKISNGDFEDNITNWSAPSGQSTTHLCGAVSGNGPDIGEGLYTRGECSLLWIYGGSLFPSITRSVVADIAVSSSYRVCGSFREATGSAIQPSQLMFRHGSDPFAQPTSLAQREDKPAWWYACWSFTATSTSSTVQWNIEAPIDTLYIDEVQLTPSSYGELPFSEISTLYSVTRNLDGTGANVWDAGSAVLNTGTCGDGFIDLYSVSGLASGTQFGPSIVGNVRTECADASDFNAWSERWAAGNLRGVYSYTTDIYGFAAGDDSAAWFAVDPTNGLRMMDGLNAMAQLFPSGLLILGRNDSAHAAIDATALRFQDASGINRVILDGTTGDLTLGAPVPGESNFLLQPSTGDMRLRINQTDKIVLSAITGDISLVGDVRGGSATALDSGAGYFLASTGAARFGNPAGNNIRWDGTNVSIVAEHLDIAQNGYAMQIRGNSGVGFDNSRAIRFDLSALGGKGWKMGTYLDGSGVSNLQIVEDGGTTDSQAIRLRAARTPSTGVEILLQSLVGQNEISLIADRISFSGQLGHPAVISVGPFPSGVVQNNWTTPGLETSSGMVFTAAACNGNPDINLSDCPKITGVVAQPLGTQFLACNVGTNGVWLRHMNTGSTAANRLYLPAEADQAVGRGECVTFIRDNVNNRWMVDF